MLTSELDHLSQSFGQLRQAKVKFIDCIKSINDGAKPEHECTRLIRTSLTTTAKSILVPLTSSLYVRGTLKNAGNVLLDIGTGYYVEKVYLLSRCVDVKSSGDAIKFYSTKVEYLDKNMEDLEKVINAKASNAKCILPDRRFNVR